ncbi:MAG: hypothetical protein ACR2QH_04675 [Geminicoccaceae bacterium]
MRNVFVLGLVAVFCPLPTQAQQGPLQLNLEGEITARCEFLGFDDAGQSVDLTGGAAQTFDFGIDCNLPMRLDLLSENGALVNEAFDDLEPSGNGWTARMPYDATITIESIGLRETTTSEDMAAGVSYRSGSAIPFETDGTLSIEIRDGGQLHPAGQYSDVISITVFADVGAGV